MMGESNPRHRWLTIAESAEYAGVSPRLIRYWMKAGLKYVRIRNVVRLRAEWIDSYLERFAVEECDGGEVDRIVEEALAGMV